MYLNAMNSFLAVQLEALWKVHLKMIVFKWIFLLGYIRKDFNLSDRCLEWMKRAKLSVEKKLNPSIGKNFVKYERECRSLPGWKERGYLINYINKMDLFIYISVDQTTKWKTEVFFLVLVFIFIDRLWQLHVKTLS